MPPAASRLESEASSCKVQCTVRWLLEQRGDVSVDSTVLHRGLTALLRKFSSAELDDTPLG